MLNKFLKQFTISIHDFLSLFFLRYLLAIFFVSISLFFDDSIFFNYEEKEDL